MISVTAWDKDEAGERAFFKQAIRDIQSSRTQRDDEDGGDVNIDLSGVSSSSSFSVTWFNPTSGNQQAGSAVVGGDTRKLSSPFSGDTVLLLKKDGSGSTDKKPLPPTELEAT